MVYLSDVNANEIAAEGQALNTDWLDEYVVKTTVAALLMTINLARPLLFKRGISMAVGSFLTANFDRKFVEFKSIHFN